jgi:HEPN domain-containing protein
MAEPRSKQSGDGQESQQAAEKAIKAVMMKRNIEFPYVHDLGRLLTLLEQAGEGVPPAVARARTLTPYAVDTRYPGTSEPVDEQQYHDAIEIADAVIRWAKNRL